MVVFVNRCGKLASKVYYFFNVLLVVQMAPATWALDLAATLHEIAPNLPILLATASADEVSAEILLAAGIIEVAHRPLMSAEIAEALALRAG